jgi:hypothetical protein
MLSMFRRVRFVQQKILDCVIYTGILVRTDVCDDSRYPVTDPGRLVLLNHLCQTNNTLLVEIQSDRDIAPPSLSTN